LIRPFWSRNLPAVMGPEGAGPPRTVRTQRQSAGPFRHDPTGRSRSPSFNDVQAARLIPTKLGGVLAKS